MRNEICMYGEDGKQLLYKDDSLKALRDSGKAMSNMLLLEYLFILQAYRGGLLYITTEMAQ